MSIGLAVSFSGRMASGKTHVTHELSRVLGWPRVGFSDYLKGLLQQQGISEPRREQLQDLGQLLVERDPDGFCREVLGQAQFVPGCNILIDGIRHMDIQRRLERLVRPSVAILIYLAPNEVVVTERIRKRGVSKEESRRAEGHIVEKEILEVLPEVANYVIDSSGPSHEIILQCLATLKSNGADPSLIQRAQSALSTQG